jgi:hypothetical protein
MVSDSGISDAVSESNEKMSMPNWYESCPMIAVSVHGFQVCDDRAAVPETGDWSGDQSDMSGMVAEDGPPPLPE